MSLFVHFPFQGFLQCSVRPFIRASSEKASSTCRFKAVDVTSVCVVGRELSKSKRQALGADHFGSIGSMGVKGYHDFVERA